MFSFYRFDSYLKILLIALLPGSAWAADAGKWHFTFDPYETKTNFIAVPIDQSFKNETGYGFEPVAAANQAADAVTSHAAYFSASVPEGNYKVTVTLGDPASDSDTTVKAELRRLMLEEVSVPKGQVVTRSFVVNVRTPHYPGGSVHLKAPRETTMEAWAWDDKLTLEFNGHHPAVRSLVVESVDVPTLYILGDSTVCDQSGEPYASWGQMLPRFLKPDIAVSNNAESGETLRSSAQAHRFDKVLSLMKPGDFLLIQYGHNDMKSKDPGAADYYEATLEKWCQQAKEKGGTPILITPMNRHSFKGSTVFNSLGVYPDKVKQAAAAAQVPLIDLNAMSKTLYESFGPDGSIALFEHTNLSKKFDATHHSPFGAYELAQCVLDGIRQSVPELASHIANDVKPFDLAKPDQVDAIYIPTSPVVTKLRPLGD
jgi:lysophospholipase L1-like esterase